MSTKIYNGYITKTNISDLLLKFKTLVSEFEKIKIAGYSKHLAKTTTFSVDRKIMNGEDVDPIAEYSEKYYKHSDTIRETISKGTRNPALDFTASVSVHFLRRNTTLLLFYDDNPDVLKFWNSLDFIQEYHYQNSSDKPDSISERDWNSRRQNWDKVLGDDAPIKSGYQFTFSGADLPWMGKLDKKSYIPSLDERVNQYYSNHWIDARTVAIRIEKQVAEFSYAQYSQAREEWKQHKETEEYKKTYAEIKAKLPVLNFERQDNKIEID
jgi:hypothetical protein